MTTRLRRGLRPVTEATRVSTAEVFFDLVFVFAFLQVTTLMIAEDNHLAVLHGLLVLSLLWWSWSLFAWLGNRVRANYGIARLTLLATTPVMFVLAVTTREAFQDSPGGIDTPLWFVGCYLAVRCCYLGLRLYSSPQLRARDVLALTVPPVLAAGLLTGAALLPRTALPTDRIIAAQVLLWVLAGIVDYVVGQALPRPPRMIFSARHWTERHNLIVIAALGEVLIAVGIAGSQLTNSVGLLAASALAVVVAGALEWIYIDLSTLVGEHALRAAPPAERTALARDCYSFLHLPMIAGIMLLALGFKHMPTLVGEAGTYTGGQPLDHTGRYALYGGVVTFLLAHAAFQWRLSRTCRNLIWPRLVAAATLLALLPATAGIPALRALAWLALACLATAVTEFLVSRRERQRLRRALIEEREGTCAATQHGPGRSVD
ncbi:low temperature requirement protein A [Micromonospora sp. NPDC049081]|uniref:low temperature requirement protein A n=1 Tax=Micromonospora sp. NPDC049081 TaxID=3155150 RepID=UPI0033D5B489